MFVVASYRGVSLRSMMSADTCRHTAALLAVRICSAAGDSELYVMRLHSCMVQSASSFVGHVICMLAPLAELFVSRLPFAMIVAVRLAEC